MTAKPWVSVDRSTKHLGFTHDSIYRWIDCKGFPAHRVERLWKLQACKVDDWAQVGGAAEDSNGSVQGGK